MPEDSEATNNVGRLDKGSAGEVGKHAYGLCIQSQHSDNNLAQKILHDNSKILSG